MNKDNDKIIKQSLDIKNEVLKIIYSINSLKNVENDLEVSFHFVDNDEEINAINTVINSAVKYVNQLVPLTEDDIKAFTPIYDIFRNCWIFPTAKLENGNSIELEFKTKKIVLFEKRKIRKPSFNEINNSVELQKKLFYENKNQKNQNGSLNKFLISIFKEGNIYEQR